MIPVLIIYNLGLFKNELEAIRLQLLSYFLSDFKTTKYYDIVNRDESFHIRSI